MITILFKISVHMLYKTTVLKFVIKSTQCMHFHFGNVFLGGIPGKNLLIKANKV